MQDFLRFAAEHDITQVSADELRKEGFLGPIEGTACYTIPDETFMVGWGLEGTSIIMAYWVGGQVLVNTMGKVRTAMRLAGVAR